jgi:photosystem II stability/assembly factor-like uncharacterized protein
MTLLMKKLLLLSTLFLSLFSSAQYNNPEVKVLTSGTKTSLRGMSVVNDMVVWVSGSNGTVGRSTDGGKNWKWISVKGFEKRDFRDIEAFNSTTALIMVADAPAYILKTNDGGESWRVVFEDRTPGMFLDAMEFWNEQAGIMLGDPINGKFFIARTFDGGSNWKEIPDQFKPTADSGEACFAASGTNIRALDLDEAVFVSGGTSSRVFIRDQVIKLPLVQGKETTGANSIAVHDNYTVKGGTTMIVVGGDFNRPESDSLNCFFTTDRGKTWKSPKQPPHGYRSCVEYLSRKHVISCGINGVDYSFDGGNTWKWISKEGFNVCRIAKNGATVYLAGSNGKIAKITYGNNRGKKGLRIGD